MAHAGIPIFLSDFAYFVPRGVYAGEMSGGGEVGLAANAGDGGMGALAGRAARAIGDGNKAGFQGS